MRYYAQFNSHGSDTSVGFANTWQVASFATKAARDAWVEQHAGRQDVSPITRAHALKMAGGYQRAQHRHGGYLAHIHYITDDNVRFERAF